MKKLFLHVGFPKTGTTFLQKKVFSESVNHQYAYVNKDFGSVKYFNIFKPKNRYKLLELFQNYDKVLISDETYIMETIQKSINNTNFKGYIEIHNLIDFLNDNNIQVKLYLVTRLQSDLLCSLYVQLLQGHLDRNMDFEKFYTLFNPKNKLHDALLFDNIKSELLEKIENINLFYSTYEDFNENKLDFIKKLIEHIELPLDVMSAMSLSEKVNSRSIEGSTKKSHPLTLRFVLYRIKRFFFKDDVSFGIGVKLKPLLDLIKFKDSRIINFSDSDKIKINNWYNT